MSAPIPPPPAHVEPYVRVLGVDLAIAFLEAAGGAEAYFSARSGSRSRWVAVVGDAGLLALEREFGPRVARVPLAKPWRAAVLRARGLSVQDIAREMHATDTTVRRWLADYDVAPTDRRQLTLF